MKTGTQHAVKHYVSCCQQVNQLLARRTNKHRNSCANGALRHLACKITGDLIRLKRAHYLNVAVSRAQRFCRHPAISTVIAKTYEDNNVRDVSPHAKGLLSGSVTCTVHELGNAHAYTCQRNLYALDVLNI